MNDLHHNCELWAEPISLLAAGCLSTDEERDVRRHFETCPDCRERFGQLTRLCGALAEAQLPVNVAEYAIVERVMSAVASEESQRSLVRTQAEMIQPSLFTRSLNRWRLIMRSPVSRIAAAAVFILAITGVAMLFQGGGGAAFAFADFAAPILEAKTVKYKMTVEMKGPPARTIESEVMVLDGVRVRLVIELPDKSKVVEIQDLSQGKQLFLTPASKTATVLTSTSNLKVKTLGYGDPLASLRLLLLDARDKPGVEREPLGEKEIDGRKVVGFHISSQIGDLRLWGDPKTGELVRVEMTTGIEGSQNVTFSDFVFNVDMDESLFSLEPPAGYTVQYQKSDSSPLAEKSLIEMFRDYSNLCDGSFPDSLDPQTTKTMVYKKANIQMNIQSMWESAQGKGKPNDEQRHKLEELMLKLTEGNLSEEQIKKIGEQIGEQLQEFIETQGQKTAEVGEPQAQETEEFRQAQFSELQQRVDRGLQFANRLPPSADAHYVGKGASFGAADTPIFWYRPKDSKNYRVIYADLSVRDSDTPPNVAKGQPAPAPSGLKE
jgi:outer membrane lipoprotein-sorting protein